MYASSRSGPVAALPASVPPPVTLGARSSSGGRARVPREGRRPGGARACGRGASVWQVSAAARAGGSHPGAGASRDPGGPGFPRPPLCASLALPLSGLAPAAGSQGPLPTPWARVGTPAAAVAPLPGFAGSLAPASGLASLPSLGVRGSSSPFRSSSAFLLPFKTLQRWED